MDLLKPAHGSGQVLTKSLKVLKFSLSKMSQWKWRTCRAAGHIMLYLLYGMDELQFVKRKKVNTVSKVCVYPEGKV